MSAEAEGRQEDFMQLYKQKEEQPVELIARILSDENIEAAIRKFRTSKNTFTVNQEQRHGALGTV